MSKHFYGSFEFSQRLNKAQLAYLTLFNKTRHVVRDVSKLPNIRDSVLFTAANIPGYGEEGEFAVCGDSNQL